MDLLVIAPHPDDAEIFCGGLIIKMTDLGHKVAIADLTLGELGSQGSVEERKKEAESASKILNLSKRINLEIPDGEVSIAASEADNKAGLKKMVKLFRELKPKLVAYPYSKGRHPDHTGAHALTKKAIFFSALKNFEPTLGAAHKIDEAIQYQMRYDMEEDFVVDISEQFERKIKAIECFSSQVKRKDEGIQTLVSSPLILSSTEGKDSYIGAKIGVKYGEGFKIDSKIEINDPIHFFSNKKSPLYFSHK